MITYIPSYIIITNHPNHICSLIKIVNMAILVLRLERPKRSITFQKSLMNEQNAVWVRQTTNTMSVLPLNKSQIICLMDMVGSHIFCLEKNPISCPDEQIWMNRNIPLQLMFRYIALYNKSWLCQLGPKANFPYSWLNMY